MTSLRAATSAAVENNRALVHDVVGQLRALAGDLRPAAHPEDDSDLARQERELLTEACAELRKAADDLLTGTETFNIVLFGRTGVGKSSLLEALTHGDGGSASPGDSDWTVEVNLVRWADCTLVDTPGIQGWGRTRSRADLEEVARRALVRADVVLLCFDSLNQQAGEFATVSDWLAAHRKPTIALLNVRNRRWRMPTLVPSREDRIELSTEVLEHAGHIEHELSAVGLGQTPLLALHTQRAMYGRVPAEFGGPARQATAFRKQRDRHAGDDLVAWSNLPVLEGLLTTAIERGADRLRRDTVLNQVVGLLDRSAERLRSTLAEPAEVAAVHVERGIEQLLTILGAPEVQLDPAVAGEPPAGVVALVERLGELERLRGGRFVAPARGAAQRHGASVIDVALGPPRAEALRRAERLVDSAMAERRTVDEARFRAEVFDTEQIQTALDGAIAELTDYLSARVGLATGDVQADLQAVLVHGSHVRGTAGRGAQVAAYGTIAVLTVAGVANLWNPAGWGMLAGAGVLTVAGLVAPRVRDWLRRRRIDSRNTELARARGAARRAVTTTFDAVRDDATGWLAEAVRQAFTTRLATVVDDAIRLRLLAGAAMANAAATGVVAGRTRGLLGPGDPAAAILQDAMRSREDLLVAPGATRRSLWLGESWCDDPTGLDEAPPADATPQPSATSPLTAHAGRTLDRLSTVLARMGTAPPPGGGQAWMAEVADLLGEDRHAAGVLAELRRLAAERSPSVVVFGDYNAGKSSFIARLLVEDGRPVPPTLRVRARPETTQVDRYPWAGLTLVDTPGLQSGRPEHTELACAQLADAALVVYLGGPAVSGDRTGLDLILHGDPDRGLVPKLDRTLFVVNRADALGVHPHDDEDGFVRLVERREAELLAALAAIGARGGTPVEVAAERVLFVASDPDGRLGSGRPRTRADFDAGRA